MANTEEMQIRQQRELWREAVESGDVDKVMSFYVRGDEYIGFDIMPPIHFVGWEACKANWKHFFSLFDGNPTFEFRNMKITCSGDLAVVHGFTRVKGVMHGNAIDTWARETNCLRKVDGEWLLIHDHVSFPVDLSTGRGAMDLTP